MSNTGSHQGVDYTLSRRAGAVRGTFQLRYTHAPTGRVRESTKTRDLDEAHAFARAHIAGTLSGGPAARWSLTEAIDVTFALRWDHAKSAATYLLNTDLLMRYFGRGTLVDDIGVAEYTGFVRWMRARGASDATINRKTSNLRVILRTAMDAGKLPGGVPRLPHLKEGVGRVRFLSDEEERTMRGLLHQWDQPVLADYLAFMVETGLRTGEALALQWRDVSGMKVTLWETKTSHPRTIPLTTLAHCSMPKRGAAEDFVWIGTDGLAPTRDGCKNLIRHWWDRAKAVMGLADDTQFVPYITRHTCASRLVMSGFHLRRVMEWMGHKRIETTLRYAHLAADALDSGAAMLEARRDGNTNPPGLRAVK